MSKLIFKTLYIFSSVEKKAKVVSFSAGTNIITSSSVDGTKRGKSLITKCLYHTMGADCFFESIWEDKDKTYILNFEIDGLEYFMYRCSSLFKLFDSNKNVIFKTINRNELGEKLKSIFNFAVQLPKRGEEKLEITPPAYSYLLYFLDQDRILGTQFASFDNLGQLIRNERRLELCFENHRFWDLRRWKANLNEPAKGINITTDATTGEFVYIPNLKNINEIYLNQSYDPIFLDGS